MAAPAPAVGTITGFNSKIGVAVNPDRSRVYVANNQSNSVTVLDPSGALLATINIDYL